MLVAPNHEIQEARELGLLYVVPGLRMTRTERVVQQDINHCDVQQEPILVLFTTHIGEKLECTAGICAGYAAAESTCTCCLVCLVAFASREALPWY